MISIEHEEVDKDGCDRNKQFAAIRMAYGLSSAILPEIKWDPPTIVWLDYDSRLDGSTIADVQLVAGAAAPGTALIVTFCADPEDRDDPLEELRELVGPERTPIEATSDSLVGWGFGRSCRSILRVAIDEAL